MFRMQHSKKHVLQRVFWKMMKSAWKQLEKQKTGVQEISGGNCLLQCYYQVALIGLRITKHDNDCL